MLSRRHFTCRSRERTLNPFVGIHSSSWTWSVHPSIFLWASSAAAAQMAILTSNAFHANRSWQNLSPFFSSSFAEFGEIDMRAWRQLWAMSSAFCLLQYAGFWSRKSRYTICIVDEITPKDLCIENEITGMAWHWYLVPGQAINWHEEVSELICHLSS